MYNNAENFWAEEWRALNELLDESKKVMLLNGKLKPELVPADTRTDDWKEVLGKL